MRVLVFLIFSGVLNAGVLFVSPNGKFGWSGKLAAPSTDGKDGPLPNIAAARDVLRVRRRQGLRESMTVMLRGGTYRITEPIMFGPEDSNTSYVAFTGERPIISGGRVISDWKVSGGGLKVARVPGSVRELFIGNTRATRNRLPVNGFYRVDGPSSENNPFLLKFRGGDVDSSWEGGSTEAVILLLWTEIRMRILKIDQSSRIATLSDTASRSTKETDARYWLENVPAPPRAAGFWSHNDVSGELKYWPRQDSLNGEEAVVPTTLTLIQVQGIPHSRTLVNNLTFRGLEFRHTDWSIPAKAAEWPNAALEATAAIQVKSARSVKIDHCTFTQIGGYAVYLSAGVTNSAVTHSEIFDAGAGGIRLGDGGTSTILGDETRDNVITDNEIHDNGVVYPSAVGIWVGNSGGNEISHNHVHDMPYTGIWIGTIFGYGATSCKDNRVEYNHVNNIGENTLSDMGGIYTTGEQPGTLIRNNLIHDIKAFDYGGWGIYLDEGSSGLKD